MLQPRHRCSLRSTSIAGTRARMRMQSRGALKMKPKSAALDNGEDGAESVGESDESISPDPSLHLRVHAHA
jgi:hypothetical protein